MKDTRDYSDDVCPRKCVRERFPILWNHVIEKESLNTNKLEHAGIEKVEQLFRDMLWRAAEWLFDARHFFELAPNWRPRPPNRHG